ncbi:MAG: Phosphoheptose isomerase 1 [Legionellaceae bacterium]
MLNTAEIIQEHIKVIAQLEKQIPAIEQIAAVMSTAIRNQGTIFWIGNGGSAADAQHMAAELVGRFKTERKALSSIALTTDTSILTSLSNDYDYSIIFSRQVEALCKPGDIVIGLSTSGNSKNVCKGLEAAKACQAITIGLTGGNGGKLIHYSDYYLMVPSHDTARIQEAHGLIGHILCGYIEACLV